jgi:hypothetical protein
MIHSVRFICVLDTNVIYLKDFPEEYLARFGLAAKTADDFLTDIIERHEPASSGEVTLIFPKSLCVSKN